MRAKFANLNHCAVPFLSGAVVNLNWYNSTLPIAYQITLNSDNKFYLTITCTV